MEKFNIPLPTRDQGLDLEEVIIYQKLNQVVKNRIMNRKHPRDVLVISDLAKDYDDLHALIILKELHRLGLIRIKGVVANLAPASDRARFGRGALDKLELQNVPIAVGSDGTDTEHPILDHEFKEAEKSFMASRVSVFKDGQTLIKQVFEEAAKSKTKISVLLISSLRDINTFSRQHGQLFNSIIRDVTLQGGYTVQNGHITWNPDAANNKFDTIAATQFHRYLEENEIRSITFTKIPTFAMGIPASLYDWAKKLGHPLGIHLRLTQEAQEKSFYAKACSDKPFLPFMTKAWYLDNKTTWWKTHNKSKGEFPESVDEVIPFLNKLVVYDALPALAVAGDDVLDALNIMDLPREQRGTTHRFVGTAETIDAEGVKVPSRSGIHPVPFGKVLTALTKGSLLACVSGIGTSEQALRNK